MNKQLIKNIVGTQNFFWRSMAPDIYENNNVFGWATNIDNKYLNGATSANIMSEPASQVIQCVIQFFTEKNLPWLWVVNPLCKLNSLEELLISNGFNLAGNHPVMWYDLSIMLPDLRSKNYDIREVIDASSMSDWNIPLDEGFGPADDHSNNFFQLTKKIPYGKGQAFHHYVSYVEGKPVSCATLSTSKYGARIDNVGTCNNYLRQGFARAITLFAMYEAKKLGYNMVCLESSDEGLSLYLNIGFKEIYQNKVYELKV